VAELGIGNRHQARLDGAWFCFMQWRLWAGSTGNSL
jgi:hypothetical protein